MLDITISPANKRQFIPPKNNIPMAIVTITTKAPKSGSRSNKPPVNSITPSIGKKPFLKLSINAALRTV